MLLDQKWSGLSFHNFYSSKTCLDYDSTVTAVLMLDKSTKGYGCDHNPRNFFITAYAQVRLLSANKTGKELCKFLFLYITQESC